jgi:hypothetical protein
LDPFFGAVTYDAEVTRLGAIEKLRNDVASDVALTWQEVDTMIHGTEALT